MRRGLGALSTGWLVVLVVPLSGTGLDFPAFALTFGITVLLGIVSLGLVLARRSASRLRLVAWLLYPLGAAALVALFLTAQSPANPLFRARFHLSAAALQRAAHGALAGRPAATPAWVGLFPVHRIDVFPPEVRFMSDGCGVVDECGLVYRPGAAPAGRSKTRLRHLDGPWYHLYSVF